jgi:hypothetical protein
LAWAPAGGKLGICHTPPGFLDLIKIEEKMEMFLK